MSSFLKWHIYRASLDPVVGSEQGKSRPVLVISEDVIWGDRVYRIAERNNGSTLLPIRYSVKFE